MNRMTSRARDGLEAVVATRGLGDRDLVSVNAELAKRVRALERQNQELRDRLIRAGVDITKNALERLDARSLQQAVVAEIGQIALGAEDLQALLDHAADKIANCLGVSCTAIFAHRSERDQLRLQAGRGWAKGLVGRTTLDAAERTETSLALHGQGPVIIDDTAAETHFAISELLSDHDIKAAAAVPIGPMVDCWGVLGAYHDACRDFTSEDAHFLQSIANTLWLAIGRHRARVVIESERQQLRQLTDGLSFQVSMIGADLRYELNNKAYEAWGWPREQIEGMPLRKLVGEGTFAELEKPIAEVLEGRPVAFELAVRYPGGTRRTNLVHYVPRRNADGGVNGFFSAAIDITERKQIEEQNALISAELDHRVKNILAIVSSIAQMTGRDETSIDAYRSMFEARIEALARTHTALASGAWAGMPLEDILADELDFFRADRPHMVTWLGPRVHLEPKAAQSLAMAIHELATNAVKYGALARTDRHLDIAWAIDGADGEPIFTFLWRERGLDNLVPPAREGFGTSIMRDALRVLLRADVRLRYESTGISFSIRCALSHISRC